MIGACPSFFLKASNLKHYFFLILLTLKFIKLFPLEVKLELQVKNNVLIFSSKNCVNSLCSSAAIVEWNPIPSMISDHLAFWLHSISTEKSLFWNKGWLQLLLFSLSMDFHFRSMYFLLWKLKMLNYSAAGAYHRYANFSRLHF